MENEKDNIEETINEDLPNAMNRYDRINETIKKIIVLYGFKL